MLAGGVIVIVPRFDFSDTPKPLACNSFNNLEVAEDLCCFVIIPVFVRNEYNRYNMVLYNECVHIFALNTLRSGSD